MCKGRKFITGTDKRSKYKSIHVQKQYMIQMALMISGEATLLKK